MTTVTDVLAGETGQVLASFREIPIACLESVSQIQKKLQAIDIGGLLIIGSPNQSLLEIPVGLDKAGVVVMGGLNPIAVLHENGIKTESFAMSELVEYEALKPYKQAFQEMS